MRMRVLAAATLAMLLVGCASQPKVAASKPVIKSIAIVPATNPADYRLENVSAMQFVIPLAATANYLDSREKAKQFNAKLAEQSSPLAANFTEAVASALRGYGYQVQIVGDVTRPADDPDTVDLSKVSTGADAVLQIRFTDVGLYSPRSSTRYLPMVQAHGTLFVKGLKDHLYDEDIWYGVNARKGKSWAIEADEKIGFDNFEAVMANVGTIGKVFETGASEISKRLSEQVHESVR
jgi:hypothetical protein